MPRRPQIDNDQQITVLNLSVLVGIPLKEEGEIAVQSIVIKKKNRLP